MESKDRYLKIDGEQVRKRRKELNLSQTELAIQLGITKAGVSKLEITGSANNSIRLLLNTILGTNFKMKVNKPQTTLTKVESFRSRAIEELEGMKKNEEGVTGLTLLTFQDHNKKFNEAIERLKQLK